MKTRKAVVSPVMQVLSEYIATALRKRLPQEVEHIAKVHLLDACAAMLSGSRLIPGRCAIAYVSTLGGTREACVFGTGIVTTAINAALANGMFAHADESDGSHPLTLSHPDASLVPAALALCEREGHSGTTLLRSIVLGYDVGTRVVLAMDPIALLNSGHFTAAFSQLFCSVAAASALLKLDARRTRHALSYASQQAAGTYTLFRDTHHVEKAFGMGGMPAKNGIASALMVALGCSGVDDVFSGDKDFFHTFAPKGVADRKALVRGLGRDYEILRAAIKRWPAGGPIQAPLDMMSDLLAEHRFAAQDVQRVEVQIAEGLVNVINNRDMTDISLQHLLALMILDGKLDVVSAHDYRRVSDPRIVKLKRKIVATGSARYTDARSGAMQVTLTDGRKLIAECLAAKGSYKNPLTDQDVEEKAFGLIEPVLGKARTRKLIDTLWNVERMQDVRELRKLVLVRNMPASRPSSLKDPFRRPPNAAQTLDGSQR